MSRDLKVLSLSLFFWALGEGLFIYLVPLHLEELGATPVQTGTVMALFALAQALTMLPAGVAADRWGARRVMVGGWVAGLLSAVLMAGATHLWLFALAWTTYGFSAWVIPPLTRYVASGRGALTPERAFTRVFSAFSAGLIVSPTLGGQVAQRLGLRAPFFLALAFFVVSTVVVFLVPPQASQPPPSAGRYASLLRNRRFTALMAVVCVAMFAIWLSMPLAPNFLQERWGVSVSEVGLLGSAASLGQVVLALFLGTRPPRRSLMALHTGATIYLLALLSSGRLEWLALGFFLRGGAQISGQFIDAISTRVVPPSQQGLAYGINALINRGTYVAAAAAAGWLYSSRPALPFQASLALIPIAVGLIYLFVPRPAPQE